MMQAHILVMRASDIKEIGRGIQTDLWQFFPTISQLALLKRQHILHRGLWALPYTMVHVHVLKVQTSFSIESPGWSSSFQDVGHEFNNSYLILVHQMLGDVTV